MRTKFLLLALILFLAVPVLSDGWTLQQGKSAVDDSPTAIASVRSSQTFRAWPGQSHRASLFVRCLEGNFEIYVHLGTSLHVTYPEPRTVTVRVDRKEAFDVKVSEATSRDSYFFAGSPVYYNHATQKYESEKNKLLAGLINGKRLLIRFIPFNSSPAIITFDLTGSRKAIEPVLETCGKKVSSGKN